MPRFVQHDGSCLWEVPSERARSTRTPPHARCFGKIPLACACIYGLLWFCSSAAFGTGASFGAALSLQEWSKAARKRGVEGLADPCERLECKQGRFFRPAATSATSLGKVCWSDPMGFVAWNAAKRNCGSTAESVLRSRIFAGRQGHGMFVPV